MIFLALVGQISCYVPSVNPILPKAPKSQAHLASRRQAMAATVGALAAVLPVHAAIAANQTAVAEEPAFDYAAYFGPFSCEWWGLERMPGSNKCQEKGQ